MQRGRAFRRHHADAHMRRRLKEHSQMDGPNCLCRLPGRERARFREQPKSDCHYRACGIDRDWRKRTRPYREHRQAWIE
jgi:hypothetical protein